MMRPLVSVIIPTHDRPAYAVSSIRAVLASSEHLEVVVSDTSAEDDISAAFAGQNDVRLKLLRPGGRMSVVDNFNFALAAATGEYLVFIGDDDLVSPQIAAVATWAKSNSVDAISFSFPALYFWPSFTSTTRWQATGSTLVLGGFSGRATPMNTHQTLVSALRELGAGVLEMPRAYAGMVSRELVDRVTSAHGALFGGVSPDIYSAALIAMESRKAFRIDFPVVIPGACGSSTSGKSARGKHVGGLRDNAHIGAFQDLVWDARIPEYYSVPTVWAYSLLKAIEDKPQWLRHVNFFRLYMRCLTLDPLYAPLVLRCCGQQLRSRGLIRGGSEMFVAALKELARGIDAIYRRKITKHSLKEPVIVPGVINTEQALDALIAHLTVNAVPLHLPATR